MGARLSKSEPGTVSFLAIQTRSVFQTLESLSRVSGYRVPGGYSTRRAQKKKPATSIVRRATSEKPIGRHLSDTGRS